MILPSMYDVPTVLNLVGISEDSIFEEGVGGTLEFLVVVPELGACRVSQAALSHFLAGADEYRATEMPEFYSGALSGGWTIKRDRLRILADSFNKFEKQLDDIAQALERAEAAKLRPRPPSHDDLVKAGWVVDDENPQEMMVVTEVMAGHISKIFGTKLQLSYLAEQRRQRQAKGLWTVCEVAQLFEDSSFVPNGAGFLNRRLLPAIWNGNLRAMSESDGFAVDGEKVNPIGDYLRPEDVNVWLEKEGATFRWGAGATEAHAGVTRAQFLADAAAQDVLQDSAEYQSRYARAHAILEEISRVEKSSSDGYDEAERREKHLADLHAALAAIDEPENRARSMTEATQPSQEQTGEAISVTRHSTKSRRDVLTPVIELAQSQCRKPLDTAEVWAALLVLANKKTPPLLGATEDGLQYLNNGAAEIFKRDSLRKRLAR